MPSNAFFAMRTSHVISDAAFRAFVMIEHGCDSDGLTPEMSVARANVEFCGLGDFKTTDLADPIAELASAGLIRIERTSDGVRVAVDTRLVYSAWDEE